VKIIYNIHNLLKIRIDNISRHLVKDLNLRYHYFEDKSGENPDILVTIGPFKPDLKDCFCLDRKFYIKKNYIYLRDSDKGLKWEAEIYDIEKDTLRISFNHHFRNFLTFPWFLFPDLIMELYILQPIIEWRLLLKGYFLLHAGAVCKDGMATLIVGRGGSGKTQVVIDLLRKGFELISDDMVILKDKQVLSLPLSLGLFSFSNNLGREDLSFLDKIRLLRFLAKKNIRLHPVTDSAELDKTFVIFSTPKSPSQISVLGYEELIRCLILNQKMEKTSYVSYKYIIGDFLNAYEYVFPKSIFHSLGNNLMRDILDKLKTNNIKPQAIRLSDIQNIGNLICRLL
jgi:hypothetical protein